MKCLPSLLLAMLLSFNPVGAMADDSATQPPADSAQISDLDQLLRQVKTRQAEERKITQAREARFLKDKNHQQALLQKARRDFDKLQQQNNPLLKKTETNQAEIQRLKALLKERKRDLGDLHSVFDEFTGDVRATLGQSLVSAQLPERNQVLAQLSQRQRQRLATIDEMEQLWLLMQQEMTEAGKIARFDAPVVAADGSIETRPVLRVGPFTAISTDGNALDAQGVRFLRYIPETAELLDPQRQPDKALRQQAGRFAASSNQWLPMVLDPSRGSLLGTLTHTPTLAERIAQGGEIGLIILGLGAIGALLTLWRLLYLCWVSLKIRLQLRQLDQPRANNPLGRVILSSWEPFDNSDATPVDERMQYRLDEAILTEIPPLERSHSFIKLLAATSPLLGLLGTVTGMILTFQAISLYGSGDPKLMASGISQALVTTVLGLVVAIPLLFGHNLVSAMARSTIQRLDEQSAGLMAEQMERDSE